MDVRALFGAMDRMSDVLHRAARLRELAQLITLKECGGCALWMTRTCPREKHDSTRGFYRGPSSGAAICERYVEQRWVADQRAQHRAEMAALATQAEETNS